MEYSFEKLFQSPVNIALLIIICIAIVFFIKNLYTRIRKVNKEYAAYYEEKTNISREISKIRYSENKYISICVKLDNCQTKIFSLENFQPLELPADKLLEHANDQEISVFGKILKDSSCNKKNVIDLIRCAGSHSVASLFRRLQDGPTYIPFREVLDDVGNAVGVTNPEKLKDIQLESVIVEKSFERTLEKMSEEDRKNLESGLAELAAKHGRSYKGLTSATASVAIAQASGFGIYLMASTLVGAVTNLVGITLPFIFFTTMSKTIALCIGPLGWGFLGLYGIHRLGSPNYKKTIPAIIMISMIRYRIELDRENDLCDKQKAKSDLITNKSCIKNGIIDSVKILNTYRNHTKYESNANKIDKFIKNTMN
jgi:uncharacterized protein YaaW (UPF0174 family)